MRSKNEIVTPTTDVYIADTMGELKPFIAGSDFVVMGGSFVPKGGHNILEVAQLGKAVVFGPDMRSFEDEANLFLKYNSGLQCNTNELAEALNNLLTDFKFKQDIEKNTLSLIENNKNILNSYYSLFHQYF